MPEPDIDTPLVSRLIAAQFLRWAGLPITRVPSGGTDNAIYRLGDHMAVRLPRRPSVAPTLTKEQNWLSRLAPSCCWPCLSRLPRALLGRVSLSLGRVPVARRQQRRGRA